MRRLMEWLTAGSIGAATFAGGEAFLDSQGGFDSYKFCQQANVVTVAPDEHIGGNRYMLQAVQDGVIFQLDWADAPVGQNFAASLSSAKEPDGKPVGISPEGAQCIYESAR